MIRTPEAVIRALRDGHVAALQRWIFEVFPRLAPEQLPAPAVRHPLEFVCLPLHRDDRYGLCVHVWEGDRSVHPVSHAHSWDLWSYVFRGTIFNQTMSVHDEAKDPESRVYEVKSVGAVDEIRATGRLVRHSLGRLQEVHTGHIYQLPAGRFHRSGHHGPTATIVLGEHDKDRDNLILGDIDGEPWTSTPRRLCSTEEVRHLLHGLSDS
jgi:hypothetical protein